MLAHLNCNKFIGGQDLSAPFLYLLDPDEFQQTHPDCPGQWAGDINQDAVVDIADWVALLHFVGPPSSTRPVRDVDLQPLLLMP